MELQDLGFTAEDIDVIVLSHLHFDHAGGLLKAWKKDEKPQLAFPRAHYVVSEEAWQRALKTQSPGSRLLHSIALYFVRRERPARKDKRC